MDAVAILKERLKKEIRACRSLSHGARLAKSAPPDWDDPMANEADRSSFSYARLVKAVYTGDWRSAQFEKAAIQKSELYKALGAQTFSGGGALIPEEQDKEIIDALRAEAIATKLGVPVRPMSGPILRLPRLDSSTAAQWGASGVQRTESTNQTFGQVELIAKTLWIMIYIERELIMDSDPNVDFIVREDSVQQLALAVDAAFFLGTGVAPEPLGMLNDPDVNEPDTGGIAVGALDWNHTNRMLTSVLNDNGMVSGWATTPQVWNGTLCSIKDNRGLYIARQGDVTKGEPRTLHGLPVEISTQLANAAGTTHYLFCGDFKRQAVIGERVGTEIRTSDHFRFDRDQVAMKIQTRLDMRLKQPAAFARLSVTGVTTL